MMVVWWMRMMIVMTGICWIRAFWLGTANDEQRLEDTHFGGHV